jgi:hypothetical protein
MKLKKIIKYVATERMNICSPCEHNSKNKEEFSLRPDEHCTLCGCTLSALTKCLSCCCEMDKWTAIVTEEQEAIINDGQ